MANWLDVPGLDLQVAAHSHIKRKRPSTTLSELNFVAPPVRIRDRKLPGLDTPKFALPSGYTVHSSEAFSGPIRDYAYAGGFGCSARTLSISDLPARAATWLTRKRLKFRPPTSETSHISVSPSMSLGNSLGRALFTDAL